jgi:hypothetical protein
MSHSASLINNYLLMGLQVVKQENVNETAMTRSFFSLLSLPWRSQTFFSKAETTPKQVTNCERYCAGGSPLWTSPQITARRERLDAVAQPSGSPNVGFTRSGRPQFKGSVRPARLFSLVLSLVYGVGQNEINGV